MWHRRSTCAESYSLLRSQNKRSNRRFALRSDSRYTPIEPLAWDKFMAGKFTHWLLFFSIYHVQSVCRRWREKVKDNQELFKPPPGEFPVATLMGLNGGPFLFLALFVHCGPEFNETVPTSHSYPDFQVHVLCASFIQNLVKLTDEIVTVQQTWLRNLNCRIVGQGKSDWERRKVNKRRKLHTGVEIREHWRIWGKNRCWRWALHLSYRLEGS